jgi:hypothetical protein
LKDAHKLGAHHVAVSANGKTAASAGFGGEVKVWSIDDESTQWALKGSVVGATTLLQFSNSDQPRHLKTKALTLHEKQTTPRKQHKPKLQARSGPSP